MTELLIVSRPRGRIFKWIYGQYRSYLSPINFSKSGSLSLSVDAAGKRVETYQTGDIAQRFKTPDVKAVLSQVSLWLDNERTEYDYSIDVSLYSDADGIPGSKIASLGTITVPRDTSFQEYVLSGFSIELEANSYYWIYLHQPADNGKYYIGIEYSDDDPYADGYVWCSGGDYYSGMQSDWDIHFAVMYSSGKAEIPIDFIYDGAAEKRLEATFTSSTGLSKIVVNGQDTGADLLKEESIPQADNYIIELRVGPEGADYTLSGSIQRWLYYNKTTITLDDLSVSEAYLQEIEFGSDGGVLRIDDDPAGDIAGSAGEKVTFTDILVPFRKLEWISGGGEVLILGVE